MKILSLFIICSFLLTAASVQAIDEPVTLEPVEDRILTHQDRFVTFLVKATNNKATQDDFHLLIDGKHLEWTFPSHIVVHLEPGETKELKLDAYPKYASPGVYVYKFELLSETTGSTDSVPLYLEIKESFIIESFDAVTNGNQLRLAFAYDTEVEQHIDVPITIRDQNDNIIKSVAYTESIINRQTVTKSIDLPESTLAGDYKIEIDFIPYVAGDIKSMDKIFTVEAVHNVIESEKRTLTPFYEEVEITATNDGNIEENYLLFESFQGNFLTGFITQPDSCDDTDQGRRCQYLLESLPPGASRTITYRIEYWPIYIQIAVIALIIISFVAYSFSRATAPTIRKIGVRKKGQKYSVTLYIKNPFRHHLRGVMVRDWVSPLADITPEFSMKPVARKSEAGTELLWNIGNIKPRDEVLINYTIKTTIEGNIKLPKAHARYFDKHGNQSKIFSKPLEID